MSINIDIIGKRKIIVKKNGREETQVTEFSVMQTPTEVTQEIMASKDKVRAYRVWANKVNPSHSVKFHKWTKLMDEEGYDIEFIAG